jgi:hypothetical protein
VTVTPEPKPGTKHSTSKPSGESKGSVSDGSNPTPVPSVGGGDPGSSHN